MNRQKVYTRGYVSKEENPTRSWVVLLPKKKAFLSCSKESTNANTALESLIYFFFEKAEQEIPYEVFVGHTEIANALVHNSARYEFRNWNQFDIAVDGFDIKWRDCEGLKTGKGTSNFDKCGILAKKAAISGNYEPFEIDLSEGGY